MPPRPVLQTVAPQLKRAQHDVEDTRASHEDAVARRDRLIVQAVDDGFSQQGVVEATGLSRPRITAILAASQRR